MSWLSDPVGSITNIVKNPVRSVIGAAGEALTGGIISPGVGGAGGAGGVGGAGVAGGGPQPTLAPFESIRNADGTIKTPYQSTNYLNTQALEASRGEALRDPGTQSRWAQMANADQQNQLRQQQAGQLGQAQGNLAMQGGLRTGSRERLARQGMQTGLMAQQQTGNQIKMQDELNRQRWLQAQTGMENQAAQYKSGVQDANINRATGDVGQNRAWDMGRYSEAMRAWAAANTAAAMPQSTDKGFLGNLTDNFKF